MIAQIENEKTFYLKDIEKLTAINQQLINDKSLLVSQLKFNTDLINKTILDKENLEKKLAEQNIAIIDFNSTLHSLKTELAGNEKMIAQIENEKTLCLKDNENLSELNQQLSKDKVFLTSEINLKNNTIDQVNTTNILLQKKTDMLESKIQYFEEKYEKKNIASIIINKLFKK